GVLTPVCTANGFGLAQARVQIYCNGERLRFSRLVSFAIGGVPFDSNLGAPDAPVWLTEGERAVAPPVNLIPRKRRRPGTGHGEALRGCADRCG
ncbi:MAG: hypothetical protein M3N10_08185, partial [Actinomycetota bacterium]|nr:hypothetical protein [Actinomycetota bacterium]